MTPDTKTDNQAASEPGSYTELRELDLYRMGSVYKNLGNLEKAREWYERLLEQTQAPNLISGACFHLGDIFKRQNNPGKAAEYLKKSLEIDPGHEKAKEFLNSLSTPVDKATEEISDVVTHPKSTGKAARLREDQRTLRKEDFIQNRSPGLNILFIQNTPCIRNYKYASALKKSGNTVTLAYSEKKLSQRYELDDDVYREIIKVETPAQLKDLSSRYDIIHSHNEPDVLTLAAIESRKPVIHDTHDLISLRHKQDIRNLVFTIPEALAQEKAAGCIYTTLEQQETSQELYPLKNKPTLVIGNYCSREDIPAQFLPKLSTQEGGIHIVYEGGLDTSGHRNFFEFFHELLTIPGIHLHVYPTAGTINRLYKDFSQSLPRLHIHKSLSPKLIIREMSQYDVGIIPFIGLEKYTREFLDTTIANKLYEYLAAGMPVITSDLKSYRRFFKEHPSVGFCYREIRDIAEGIPLLLREEVKIDFSQYVFTYENEIPKLLEFYNTVIKTFGD